MSIRHAPFNGMCRTLDCFFGPRYDPGDNVWMAIKVRRDGNMEEIGGPFETQDEAERCAGEVREQELEDHGAYGVGA